MKRRLILVPAALAVVAAISVWWWQHGRAPHRSIVLITLDTTRADRIGCYGYDQADTPNLDRLAAHSVKFDRAYTVAPITLPAHATLLTGRLPPEHGLRINGVSRLPDAVPTLAQTLAAQGYRTGAFVSSLVLDQRYGLARGFETYDDRLATSNGPRVERPAAETVSAAINWLASADHEPVFCWVHLYDPHEPYDAHAADFGDRYLDRPYDAELAYMDRHIGRLLDAVAQHGKSDRTLLVVVGDHGEGLGQHGEATHGYLAYNTTLHVPLLIRVPQAAEHGAVIADPVSLADVYPTILDCLELASPTGLSGRSLRPFWQAEHPAPRACYSETEAPYLEGGWSPLRAWTTDRWKYIQSTVPELYDLEADPGEAQNLFDQQPDEAALLAQELATFEGSLVAQQAEPATASAEELQALRGLGYAGGQAPARKSAAPLRDIKETLPYAEQVHHAMHLIDNQQAAEAQRMLEAVVAALPDYPKAWGTLGVCLAVQEQYAEAEPHYRRALELDGNQNFARIGLGRALFALNRLEECVEQLAVATRIDPSALDAQFYLGEACRRLQRWDQADAALSAATRIAPEFTEARRAFADLARDRGELDAAADRYLDVLQRDPSADEAAVSRARVLAQLKRDGEAIETLEILLQRSPQQVDGLTELATLLATSDNKALRDARRAAALAEQACRLSNRRAAAPLRALAAAQAAAERWHAAIATAQEALDRAKEANDVSAATAIEADLVRYREQHPSTDSTGTSPDSAKHQQGGLCPPRHCARYSYSSSDAGCISML